MNPPTDTTPGSGARLTAFLQTGVPLPSPAPDPTKPKPNLANEPNTDVKNPPIGMDPMPGVEQDLSKPINPRPDQTPASFAPVKRRRRA